LLRHLCLLPWLVPVMGTAATLRVCVDDATHFPVLMPKLGGSSGILLRMAAADTGVELVVNTAPVARCRELIRGNLNDAFPMTPYLPQALPFFDYPMKNGNVDQARAIGHIRNMVFRLKTSKANWDGTRFQRLAMPVLINFGASLVFDRLTAMQLRFDDNAKTLEANFKKMLVGRGDVTVALEGDGMLLLAKPEYRDKIEMLPKPFSDEPYYLAISKAFVASNPGVAERLWDAIPVVRASPPYLAALRELSEQATKAPKE
jgi:polar amino acid transport system substrate-binding protein